MEGAPGARSALGHPSVFFAGFGLIRPPGFGFSSQIPLCLPRRWRPTARQAGGTTATPRAHAGAELGVPERSFPSEASAARRPRLRLRVLTPQAPSHPEAGTLRLRGQAAGGGGFFSVAFREEEEREAARRRPQCVLGGRESCTPPTGCLAWTQVPARCSETRNWQAPRQTGLREAPPRRRGAEEAHRAQGCGVGEYLK